MAGLLASSYVSVYNTVHMVVFVLRGSTSVGVLRRDAGDPSILGRLPLIGLRIAGCDSERDVGFAEARRMKIDSCWVIAASYFA